MLKTAPLGVRTLASTFASIVALAACAITLASCGRASITFTLNPEPVRLSETAVLEDSEDELAAKAAPASIDRSTPALVGSGKVALIDVRGMIIDAAQRGFLTPASNPVDELVARLQRAEKDPQVRAIVIRINSPGGSVTASDTMYREVRRFREFTGKPVVITMGEVAASGGYYLAMAGDKVLAQPTTITGSIGVIIPTVNVSQGLSRIGIVSRSVKSGANKDLANPLEPMRDEQYAVLQHMVDDFYARFRALVLERRPKESNLAARADELMDGRVMSGEDAFRAGLVDQVGDVRDALREARRLAGLSKATLVKYHDEGSSVRSVYAMDSLPTIGDGSGSSGVGGGGGGGGGGTEINLIQLRLGDGSLSGGLQAGGNAYYLWTLGGGGM